MKCVKINVVFFISSFIIANHKKIIKKTHNVFNEKTLLLGIKMKYIYKQNKSFKTTIVVEIKNVKTFPGPI